MPARRPGYTRRYEERRNQMKRLLFAMIAVLAIVLNPGSAQAASASGAQHYDFKGDNAYADFYSESGCVATNISISAGEDRPGAGGVEARSWAYVSVYEYDYCIGQLLKVAYGYTELTPEAFHFGQQGADLAATVELFDDLSWTSSPMTFNIVWTATGSSATGINHYVYRSPGFKEIYHSVGTYQQASAVATVTTSDGSNLTPDPTAYAGLSSSKSGYVQIG
jgi:hypothetical protein